jgi:hypothetical protein
VKPAGADSVNLNKGTQSEFTITEVPGALTYSWSLNPAEAGSVSGTGTTGSVIWDKNYRGLATLQVKASNSCGEGLVSGDKTVKLYAPLGIAEIDGIGIKIFPNPNNGTFSLDITSAVVNKVNITIVNELGVTVYTDNDVKFNGKLHKNLDLTGYAKGIYHLKVKGGNISNTINVVIGR